jgi:DNA-binding MarR family transcriptional regulator/GNAT superfamily N-acetyltransferase
MNALIPSARKAVTLEDKTSFRRFNRMYTRLIGTLNEGLLGSEFSLAQARVLYELANRAAPRAVEIAEDLALDAGYLSRMLRGFEATGLLTRRPSAKDGRFAELDLTEAGRRAFAQMNARSDAQAGELLGALSSEQCRGLMAAMETIEGLLGSSLPGGREERGPGRSGERYVLRSHRIGDMGMVAQREGMGYAEQFGWNGEFEALVAKIAGDFVLNFDPAWERCWIAEIGGRHAGHIFLVKHPDRPGVAKLRLLFVEPEARGMGLGDALVKECLEFARSAGYRGVVLWTQSMLTSAIGIYRRAGFRLVKEEPHHSFGHDLVGQEWELDFNRKDGEELS